LSASPFSVSAEQVAFEARHLVIYFVFLILLPEFYRWSALIGASLLLSFSAKRKLSSRPVLLRICGIGCMPGANHETTYCRLRVGRRCETRSPVMSTQLKKDTFGGTDYLRLLRWLERFVAPGSNCKPTLIVPTGGCRNCLVGSRLCSTTTIVSPMSMIAEHWNLASGVLWWF
jgi:hypothetical protein